MKIFPRWLRCHIEVEHRLKHVEQTPTGLRERVTYQIRIGRLVWLSEDVEGWRLYWIDTGYGKPAAECPSRSFRPFPGWLARLFWRFFPPAGDDEV